MKDYLTNEKITYIKDNLQSALNTFIQEILTVSNISSWELIDIKNRYEETFGKFNITKFNSTNESIDYDAYMEEFYNMDITTPEGIEIAVTVMNSIFNDFFLNFLVNNYDLVGSNHGFNLRAFLGYIIRHDIKLFGFDLSNGINLLGLAELLDYNIEELDVS